ncbi:MAG: carbohydrate-binding protein [Armatimonadota bacterium]|nr:carbohydrate-binding protein [Armatimonadota bacterium]
MLTGKRRAKATLLMMTVAIVAVFIAAPVAAQLLIDDSLQSSTSGTRNGGTFANGGWQVTGTEDWIFWHLPYSVSNGAAEFYVKGINPNQPEKNEHFHMYDYTYNNADYSYSPGYRESPHKMFIRKSGTLDAAKNNSMECLWQISPNYTEPDTSVLSWNSSTNYLFRVEWFQEGSNSRLMIYRDGVNIMNTSVAGTWNPGGHSVRIAKCRGMGEGAQINAVYSYMKVWNTAGGVPTAPTVNTPSSGSSVKSNLAFIKWSGSSHDRYQVRCNTANDASTGIAYDSGETMSGRDWAWTGQLNNATYYVFVRLGNVNGWSAWSATGYSFTVNTGYVGSNNVLVNGQSLRDNNGPFLAVGFSHMRGLHRCKYDRGRYMSDLNDMSSKGFKFQRILSMVSWDGLEIMPIDGYDANWVWTPAWPDYWQQFRDAIDIAYDNYGIRTEVTIFADAQKCMANDADRYAHCDNVIANLAGREHKVIQLEVVNEGWQNGFPDENVTKIFAQYLADRTSLPVSITSPVDTSNNGVLNMYSGSAADITNVHTARDTSESGWAHVRDSWRFGEMYPNIPPGNSNEPMGPQSSVAEENDPTRLMAAAAFTFISGAPMYVYHGRFGTSGIDKYDGHDIYMRDTPGFGSFQYLASIISGDVASWIRNDGKESAAPFTVYSNGQANKYWTDIGGATSGCHRNIGARKGNEFLCMPQGILGGGLTLEARAQLTFKVFNPMTGGVVMDTVTKNPGDQIALSGSPNTYIVWGAYGTQLPAPPGAGGGGGSKTLNSRGSTTITIDGATSDWNLSDFTTKIRGGQSGAGDTGIVGFDGSTCYYGSYAPGTVLPTSASDHTATIYSRNSSTYLYFLVRCDDNDMQYGNPVGSNWANDCVEFYIDPENDGGSTAISNSTTDIQLVIDANNQKNVYCTTSGYATQVLNGVTSAVVRDGTGWWLETRITKSALDADIPGAGNTIGLDFNFRDNDNNNDAALTSVYAWNDPSYSGFPSKIPNNWGDCFLDATQTPYSGVISLPGTIQAENYDVGGRNISYGDTDTTNDGGQYRSDGVDISTTTDTGGGYCVGWIVAGEWLEYTVSVASTGDYSINTRVASPSADSAFKIQIDGADVALSTKSFPSTGDWQNWTTIVAPSCYLTAGQHILRFCCETGDFNVNWIDVASRGADAVSMDLGGSEVSDGMSHIQVADGDTLQWVSAGHYCRENLDYPDVYMYFGVADSYAFNGNRQNLKITFDYYDVGTGTLGMDYDSTSAAYTAVTGPTLTNTLTWKTYTFSVSNAYFGNRQNGGADFRLWVNTQQEWGIDTVVVYDGIADTTAPGNVTGFTVTPGNAVNALAWTNPTDPDFTGVKIMFKTTGYPTGPTDGTQCYDGNATSYSHSGLTNGTTYYYKAYSHDAVPNYASGAQASGMPQLVVSTINVKSAANLNLVIDANSSDWNLATDFTTKTRGGQNTTGDYALIGWDGASLYYGGYWNGNVLPADAADHTAKVYTRHDQQYMYFLVRCDDSEMNYPNSVDLNWANDCIEIYIDPGHDHGSTSINNSTSDMQLVFDCNNQKNVYMTTAGYATQVLNGVTSAVVRDSTGWWLEAKILKSAIDPDLPASGAFGVDFLFRDVDGYDGDPIYGDPAFSTMYSWRDIGNGASKIPDNWGDASLVTLAADTTAPAPVTGLIATPGIGQIALSWTNPATADWAGSQVRFKTTGYPTGPTDGTQIYNGTGTSYTHPSLSENVNYYYAAYSYDEVPNYAAAAQVSSTPTDLNAPANVTGFTATPGSLQVNLSWTNPTDVDFAGTMVRFRTDAFPTSPTDGTQCYYGTGTSYNHAGLTEGQTYYYKAFTRDEAPNYSSGVTASGTVYNTYTISDSTFNSDAQGWTITTWRASTAYSYGTMAWNSGAGNPSGGGMRSTGSGSTDSTDRCTREGGEIKKTISTVGYEDIKVQYDLKVNSLGTAKTGAGSGSCTVDHNLIDEQLTVFYSTNGGSSWTEAEYLLRSALLASYQTYGTRTIDLSSVTACDNNASFVVRFRWQFNQTSDQGNLDNIKIIANGTADTTAPGPVTGFAVTPGDSQNSLSWTNPTDNDLHGIRIMFKTTGYPTGPTDGTQMYDGTGTSTVHTGLTNGTTYYYAAYAYDEVPNYSTGAQGSGTPGDTTAPGNVTGFIATSGDTQNSLSWTNPGDTDLAGVKIMFKTTGYPTSATDGTQVYNGTGTSTTHTALTNGTTYYYKAFCYDEVPNYSSGAQSSAVPADVTPPGPVTGFDAASGDMQNTLSWVNPTGDFTGTKVLFKTTGYPTGPTDGTQIYDGAGASTTHTSLTNGVTYYYAAYAHDEVPNYSTASQSSAVPADTIPPGAVTNFAVTGGNMQNSLSWANPGGDFTGTKIVFKTTGYPTSPSDGTQCYDSNGTSTTHTGLTNNTTYYYSAYAHDEVPNYSVAAQALATPTGAGTISNSTFDADANGWTVTLWKNGESYGAMGWTSGAGNPGGAVRASGVGATDSYDKCTREGADMTKTISTVNRSGISVAYDLRVNTLGGDYTGAGTGGCAVDHGLVDEQLTVYYSTNGGTNWTEVESLQRAALLATYQSYGRRTIDLTSVTACNNNANFALKFRWQVNTSADLCDLDNITVTGTGSDTTPPGNVTGFSATPGNHQNSLSWTNPTDPDLTGVKIVFKTTGYPTGPTDGTQCYDAMGTSTTHTGLTNGVTYYYKAYAHDAGPNYASGAQASGTPAGTPQQVTVQRGTYGTVIDAYLRQDSSTGDINYGAPVGPTTLRLYADTGYGTKGPRHLLVRFDLSFIPSGSTINSATFGEYYWYGTGRPDITDLKLSRVQSSASWVEGGGDTSTTVNPWPTWNQREYGATNWGTAGATGSGDIDTSTSKTYGLTGGTDGFRTVDVASFVNGWINGGLTNNGMLLHGGNDAGNGATYWFMGVCEDPTVANRPYLTVNYTAP